MTLSANRLLGLAIAVVAMTLAAPTTVRAQNAAGGDDVSFDLGFEITTHYFFRGIPQENAGLIFQPEIAVGFGLDDKTSLSFGLWNSFHSKRTGVGTGGATTTADSWYEADWSIGISRELSDSITLDAAFIAYTSPNATFATIRELDFTVSYAHELHPYATIAFEIQNTVDAGPDEGVYLELGVSKDLEGVLGDDYAVSVPLTAGFSLGSYYEDSSGDDHSFGFIDIGVDVSRPATFIPANMGKWDATFGLHIIHLGTNAARMGGGSSLTGGSGGITGAKRDFLYAKFGLSASF